jgi:hypothetical protein
MPDDVWAILKRFNEEFLAPQFAQLHAEFHDEIRGLATRDDLFTQFDRVHRRFDKIDSELQEIKSGLKRVHRLLTTDN